MGQEGASLTTSCEKGGGDPPLPLHRIVDGASKGQISHRSIFLPYLIWIKEPWYRRRGFASFWTSQIDSTSRCPSTSRCDSTSRWSLPSLCVQRDTSVVCTSLIRARRTSARADQQPVRSLSAGIPHARSNGFTPWHSSSGVSCHRSKLLSRPALSSTLTRTHHQLREDANSRP
jgi:hypothetical protein